MSTQEAPGVAPTTTEGQSRGSANCPPNEFQPTSKRSKNMPSVPQDYTEGQYASVAHPSWTARRVGPVVAIVPPASAAGHDYVGYIVEYPPSADEHPAVRALAIYDGMHRGLFRAEELQPVSADDAPPTSDEDAVAHLTGRNYVDPEDCVEGHGFSEHDPHTCNQDEPHDGDHVCAECGETWGAVDQWRCMVSGCDTVLYATGRVADGEQDEYVAEIEQHRQSHDDPRDAVRGTVGEVSAVPLWQALREVGSVYDALVGLRDLPAAGVARALRSVADVLDGGAK